MFKSLPVITPTVVGQNTTVTGDIESKGLVQVDGNFKGNIKANCIVVSKNGFVDGNITAIDTTVYGKINGNILSKKVSVMQKSYISGKILYLQIITEGGGDIDGELVKEKSKSFADIETFIKSDKMKSNTTIQKTEDNKKDKIKK
ncbi:MAG: polymer-forming cytoskeletal protein [Alphaproteobacteria bacterium]|nr:polymer-forming cytoskeletal protein [Alphaproteobacteria bacterium]MBL0718231.1 polymer-forming cytoskeletal protein [Alphaproteobacteria bacterium]